MNFWTLESLKRACGGTWLSRGKDPEASPAAVAQGLSTDSRTLRPGQAFLALRGERFDGHAFVADAVSAGSTLVIVDEAGAEGACRTIAASPESDVAILRVADTGKALLRLAAAYRKTLERTRVIAVVGSNGKTTTTRLISAVLEAAYRGTASAKSFNNAVGVPLTILSASPTDQYLLCEVGTNAPGEIAQLGAVVQPDLVVITSIGREHLEGFGSVEGVAREEASILSYLAPGGLAIVPAELPDGCQPLLDMLRQTPNVLRFGTSGSADLRASEIRHDKGRLRFTINGRLEANLALVGEHNALNALAALGVGRRFGMEERRIVEVLATARGPEMRLERIEVAAPGSSGEVTFINDAYNANPDSMLASLATFGQLTIPADWPGLGRRIAVLGDMLELGEATERSHREIGEALLTNRPLDRIVLVGPLSATTAATLTGGGWPSSRLMHLPESGPREMQTIAGLLEPGDAVLLKGSRRMRLERVIDSLRARFAGTAGVAASAGPVSPGAPIVEPPMTCRPPAVTLSARPPARKPDTSPRS